MNGRSSCSVFCKSCQIVFRHEQQRLAAHHRQVALVKNVGEQVGFRLQLRAEPLDELPVFFEVLAFHDHHQIVLLRKFLFKLRDNSGDIAGCEPTRSSRLVSNCRKATV